MSEPAIGGAMDDLEYPVKGSSCDLNLSGQRLLWVATPRPHSAEKVC